MNVRMASARALVAGGFAATALAMPTTAAAHAELAPTEVKAKTSEVFGLTVLGEEAGVTTKTVELTPPGGFKITAVADAPGWKRNVTTSGTGESTRITKVIWSGGSLPTNDTAFFQFVGTGESDKAFKFDVRQTYSDGSVVDWNGRESSDTPAPVVEAKSSLDGGGSSTLSIVALVVGGAGLVLALVALLTSRGGRPLA